MSMTDLEKVHERRELNWPITPINVEFVFWMWRRKEGLETPT